MLLSSLSRRLSLRAVSSRRPSRKAHCWLRDKPKSSYHSPQIQKEGRPLSASSDSHNRAYVVCTSRKNGACSYTFSSLLFIH